MAEDLLRSGYLVFPLPEALGARAQFAQMLDELEEFVPGGTTFEYNGKPCARYAPGFGALGGASSFHHPFVRRMRQAFYAHTAPVMAELGSLLFGDRPLFYHLLFDRVRVCPRGIQCGAGEERHRDYHPCREADSSVFGGWINFDGADQVFRCCPGTHLRTTAEYPPVPKHGKKGFVEEAAPGVPTHDVPIPPGHAIVFFQAILHEVRPTLCLKYDGFRLFVGARLATTPAWAWSADAQRWIETQGVPRLPSGEHPCLFPRAYAQYHQDRLRAWAAACIRPEFIGPAGYPQVTLSNHAHYAPYSAAERLIMLPGAI